MSQSSRYVSTDRCGGACDEAAITFYNNNGYTFHRTLGLAGPKKSGLGNYNNNGLIKGAMVSSIQPPFESHTIAPPEAAHVMAGDGILPSQ